jgi:diguanylate cyclase
MEKHDDDLLLEIAEERSKIDYEWLRTHYAASVGVVALTLLSQCAFGWFFYSTGTMKFSLSVYTVKFIAIPSLLNAAFLILGCWALHSARLSQGAKSYVVSSAFAAICIVIYTGHRSANSIYYILSAPLFLTIVYGNYRLTFSAMMLTLSASLGSRHFIKWDTDRIILVRDSIDIPNSAISVLVFFASFAICALIIRFERAKSAAGLQKELERHALQRRVQIDELTGIRNRNGLRSAISAMEADRSGSEYVFAMIDIDNFKPLNDTYGHTTGDSCLVEFGRILAERCGDAIPFRYGGDEFCILFKDVSLDRALGVCERIREDLRSVRLSDADGMRLTASVGVSRYARGTAPAALIADTDKALYESKLTKDAITVYSGRPEPTRN